MNSIIEAQETLVEEQNKEIGRCLASPHYFFINYCTVNGRLLQDRMFLRDVDLYYKNRTSLERILALKGRQTRPYGVHLGDISEHFRIKDNGL